MQYVYKVEYEVKYSGIREWMPDHANVLANGSARSAVAKVERYARSMSFEDDKGVNRKVVDFRFTGVEQIASVEVL